MLRGLVTTAICFIALAGLLPTVASADTRPPQYSFYGWSTPRLVLKGDQVSLAGSMLGNRVPAGPVKLQLQIRESDHWKTRLQTVAKVRRRGSGLLEVGTGYWQEVPRYRYSGHVSVSSSGEYRLRAVVRFKEGDEGLMWTALTASRWKRFER